MEKKERKKTPVRTLYALNICQSSQGNPSPAFHLHTDVVLPAGEQDIHVLIVIIIMHVRSKTPSDPHSPSLSQSRVQWNGQGIQPGGLFVTCLKSARWLMMQSTCGHSHSARISCRACRSHAAGPQTTRDSGQTGWPGLPPLRSHLYTVSVHTCPDTCE